METKYSIEELRKGYDVITGLDNSELSDEAIIAYMEEAMKEDE